MDSTYLEIEKCLKTLLYSEQYGELHHATRQLHQIFSNLSEITAAGVLDQPIWLPNGKAVSTIEAAHCLLEFERTRRFIRGLHQAIQEQKKANRPVHILYAGCGPYATLVTPLTTIFTPTELQFTMIERNPTSIKAMQLLYEKLGINGYIHKTWLGDATQYKIQPDEPIDILLSETMLNALRKEPQVAIMANLVPQLADHAVIIPKRVTVTAALTNRGLETRSVSQPDHQPTRIHLDQLYNCEKPFHLPKPKKLVIPPITEHNQLTLLTEINTYGREYLRDRSCSLTLPYYLVQFEQGTPQQYINFTYTTHIHPQFQYQLTVNPDSLDAEGGQQQTDNY